MFDLHGDGLVGVDVTQLDVSRVLHEEGSVEPSGAKTWRERGRGEDFHLRERGGALTSAGSDPHNSIKSSRSCYTVDQFGHQP